MFNHATGSGAMQQNIVALSGMKRRNDKGLPILDKAHMTDERVINNVIDCFLVVLASLWYAFVYPLGVYIGVLSALSP